MTKSTTLLGKKLWNYWKTFFFFWQHFFQLLLVWLYLELIHFCVLLKILPNVKGKLTHLWLYRGNKSVSRDVPPWGYTWAAKGTHANQLVKNYCYTCVGGFGVRNTFCLPYSPPAVSTDELFINEWFILWPGVSLPPPPAASVIDRIIWPNMTGS